MSFAPEVIRRIEIDPGHQRRIVDALRGVVEAPQGTAHDQWTPGLEIAGKTGTAEVSRRRERRRDQRTTEERYRERDHAWFAGFAPADDPEIVVVVLVEHGGYGGRYAAPIAFEIFREYFKRIAPR
jgi:penicillin-binding protein 2